MGAKYSQMGAKRSFYNNRKQFFYKEQQSSIKIFLHILLDGEGGDLV